MSALNSVVVSVPKMFPKVVYPSKKDYKRLKNDIICAHCKKKGHSIDNCNNPYF